MIIYKWTGRVTIGLISILMIGCGGSSYLQSPVPAQVSSSDPRFDGIWSGQLRSSNRMRLLNSSRAIGKALFCDPYLDRFTLNVHQGKIVIQIGSASTYRLSGAIDSSGRFYQSIPVSGDSYGFRRSSRAQLAASGQLEPETGIAHGVVAVTPAGLDISCQGRFQARRDAMPLPTSSISSPFKVQYRFESTRDDI